MYCFSTIRLSHHNLQTTTALVFDKQVPINFLKDFTNNQMKLNIWVEIKNSNLLS
jgi:hypothetical protein